MKKQLFLSTAIVGGSMLLVAGQAQAQLEIDFSGLARYHYFFMSQDVEGVEEDVDTPDVVDPDSETRSHGNYMDDIEFHIKPHGTSDNGLEYGAHLEVEMGTGGGTNSMDEAWVYIGGNWGEVRMGDADGVTDDMPYSGDFVLAATGGYDGDALDAFNRVGSAPGGPDLDADTGDRAKIGYYSPRFSGFQLGVSWIPDRSGKEEVEEGGLIPTGACADEDNIIQVGANYANSFNGVDVGIGGAYSNGSAQSGCEDPEGLHVGATVEFSGFGIGGSYGDNFDTGQTTGSAADAGIFWEVAGSYGMGPWKVGAGYFHSERDTGAAGDDEMDIITVGAHYNLAPGLRLLAEYNNIDDQPAGGGDNQGDMFILGTYISF